MKSGVENYINKNKRRKEKDKSILDFLPLFFPPLPSRLPKLSIDFGDTNSAPRFTHTQLHPRTPSSKQSGYICSSICRCVTEHRLIVLEIYIYISRAKLPPLSNHSIDAPHPSLVDYVCKRLPFLSIQFYPENLLKRLIVPVLVAVESPLLDQITLTLSRISGWFSSPLSLCLASSVAARYNRSRDGRNEERNLPRDRRKIFNDLKFFIDREILWNYFSQRGEGEV